MSVPRTFVRDERLKSEKRIGLLFRQGKSLSAYPMRVLWLPAEGEERGAIPVKVAFSVPKRKFKSAVARNLLKRRMREAYRLHKADLYAVVQGPIDLMLLYTAPEELTFAAIESGVKKMIRKMGELAKPKS